VRLHRWAGLFMALFLVVAGLTGSALVFHHELDRALNPELYEVTGSGPPLAPLVLRELAERLAPFAHVDHVELGRRPGEPAVFRLSARADRASGASAEPAFDQVFLDPYSGRVLGQRRSDDYGLDRARILALAYRLHYTLALPEPWGRWLFGIVATVWTIDCFVGAYLTLPRRGRVFWRGWKPAWLVRWTASLRRINFDLHRAAGLWTWAMLLVLAASSVQFNLSSEVFMPALRTVLPVAAVWDSLPLPPDRSGASALGWSAALDRGRALMGERVRRHGFVVLNESGLSFNRARGLFAYAVTSSRDIAAEGGGTVVYLSALDGHELGFEHPYVASGDAVSHWLSALHMGRVGGMAYRGALSAMGVVVAGLSITGVLIWWRARR
jgi:uncharacterized iron-regulated membrane protein